MRTHFNECVERVLKSEGVYSNDDNDTGGETVFGVSRNNFPKWKGWVTVDSYKSIFSPTTAEFKTALTTDVNLQVAVTEWYKSNFWDVFNLDEILDANVCYEIFDQAVNQGVGRATSNIQKVCNALNYQKQYGPDLVLDSKIGPATRERFQRVANRIDNSEIFRRMVDSLQGAFYIDLGLRAGTRSDYRKYMRGWFINRVNVKIHEYDRDEA